MPFWDVYCVGESNKTKVGISFVPAFKSFQAGLGGENDTRESNLRGVTESI